MLERSESNTSSVYLLNFWRVSNNVHFGIPARKWVTVINPWENKSTDKGSGCVSRKIMTNCTDFCDPVPPLQRVMAPPPTHPPTPPLSRESWRIRITKINKWIRNIRRSVLQQSLLPLWTKHFFVWHILPDDYDVVCRYNSFAWVLLFMAFIYSANYSLLSSRLTGNVSHVILNEWLSFYSAYY